MLLSSVSLLFSLSMLFVSVPSQLSYFILSSPLFISPLSLLHFASPAPIKFWSHLYIKDAPSRRQQFHVMKLAYNPFKAVKPRLNINTPYYDLLPTQHFFDSFSDLVSTYCSEFTNYKLQRTKAVQWILPHKISSSTCCYSEKDTMSTWWNG